MLTNLQRGNTQTEIPQLYVGKDITFFTLAGQGELTPDDICHGEKIHNCEIWFNYKNENYQVNNF